MYLGKVFELPNCKLLSIEVIAKNLKLYQALWRFLNSSKNRKAQREQRKQGEAQERIGSDKLIYFDGRRLYCPIWEFCLAIFTESFTKSR